MRLYIFSLGVLMYKMVLSDVDVKRTITY